MKLIRVVGFGSLLFVSGGAFAFGLSDALNTLDAVNSVANTVKNVQEQSKQQEVTQPPIQPPVEQLHSSTVQHEPSLNTVKLQKCDIDANVVNKVVSALKIGNVLDVEYSTCKKLPNSPEITVFALLTQEPNLDLQAFNLTLVTAKTDSGEIIGKFNSHNPKEDVDTEDYFFQQGAHSMLDEIRIDTANYRLNDDKRAFGIFSNVDDAGSGNYQTMTLFVQNGQQIDKILSEITLSSLSMDSIGRNNFDCVVTEAESKSVITMSPQMTNGFYDIVVSETTKTYNYGKDSNKKVCSDSYKPKYKTTNKKFILKYDNKSNIYIKPSDMY